MNDQTSAKKQETTNHNLRIKVLLDKLRTKLKDFVVLDNGGTFIGNIKDVRLDPARQLNLVISQEDVAGVHLFLLRSSHIQQVDYPSKTILLDVSQIDIHQLPEYRRSQTTTIDFSHSAAQTVAPNSTPDLSKTDGYAASSYAAQMPAPLISKNELIDAEENDDALQYSPAADIVEEEVIRLLEERLVVNMNKRKVGEVVVRKEVETRMVEVPVQYEKLIVEQVGEQPKRLAEIDLGQPEIPAPAISETPTSESQPTIKGEFTSPKTASLLLDAIARQKNDGCQLVRIEIVLADSTHQEIYQEWFNRCAGT